AALDIPADLPEEIIQKIQKMAVKTFKTLYCEGLTRVDFFLTEHDELLINEVNTIPGFTKISMYPKLWGATGIPYTELIDHLIQYGIERHTRETQLKTSI
ncbi:MAG: ATP-grasp domain-containing protein, partial [Vallitaleaceae bacterium]|nr:ATP-grasp domain-containing protein [Vallitaleaceae bacterium]